MEPRLDSGPRMSVISIIMTMLSFLKRDNPAELSWSEGGAESPSEPGPALGPAKTYDGDHRPERPHILRQAKSLAALGNAQAQWTLASDGYQSHLNELCRMGLRSSGRACAALLLAAAGFRLLSGHPYRRTSSRVAAIT